MENLTQSFRVVKPDVNPAPMPGYKVVVFKEQKGKKTVYKVLNEGENFLKFSFFSRKSYSAYAVNMDTNLSFEQSTEFVLRDQSKHITLGCRTYFQVDNPEPLAIRFRDDPIRLIWKEMKSCFKKNIHDSAVTIDELKLNFDEIEKEILTEDFYKSIGEFAASYGISIKKIVLHRTLPEEELEVATAKSKHDREMEIAELNRQKDRKEREDEREQKEHELELKRMENDTEKRNEIIGEFVKGVGKLANNIKNADDFKEAVDTFMKVAEKYLPTSPRLSLPQDEVYMPDIKEMPVFVTKDGRIDRTKRKRSRLRMKTRRIVKNKGIRRRITVKTKQKDIEYRGKKKKIEIDRVGLGREAEMASPNLLKIVADELTKLGKGQILFNPPKQMKVGEKERIEVRISPNLEANLTEGLKGKGEPTIEEIKISHKMKAELSGKDFKIEPLSDNEQIINPLGYTQWDRNVTPLKFGKKIIHLSISVILYIGKFGVDPMSYPVIEKEINVKVNLAYGVKENWKWIVWTLIALAGTIIALLSFLKS